ncbi:hypothetical protein [Ruminiclostridium herbifermentans]|uniref:hypothetical protein n=1 Tax=Ruminiclostridium herbifermentans TaxID=2488810 RepID=UPI001FD2DF1B|nr:hypothetical protein [Ruminiclostridium herbifermentans]
MKELNLNKLIKQKQNKILQSENDKDKVFQEVVLRLVDLNIDHVKAKNMTRNILKSFQGTVNVDNVFKEAMLLLLEQRSIKSDVPKKRTAKSTKKDKDDLRVIIEKGRDESKSAYEALKTEGIIKCPVEEFNLTG